MLSHCFPEHERRTVSPRELSYEIMKLYQHHFYVYVSDAANTLKFANYYQSHMVLQKAPQKAVLWGYASTLGDTVTVKLNGRLVTHVTVTRNTEGTGGVWIAKLHAHPAGGPNNISISSHDGHVTLTDVLFGDVWVCSGQSNMAFTMGRVSCNL